MTFQARSCVTMFNDTDSSARLSTEYRSCLAIMAMATLFFLMNEFTTYFVEYVENFWIVWKEKLHLYL